MKISDISHEHSGHEQTLSADCGGFRVYYTFPDQMPVRGTADPFVAASLIPAMKAGTDITLPDDALVSRQLVSNLQTLQEIFSHWEGQLGVRLQPISILGGQRYDPEPGTGTAAFFSGGVDGTYTFLRHREEIDFLLFAKGIDMQVENHDLYREAFARNSEYLAAHGKPLLVCGTNVRFLGHEHGLGWGVCFGGGLASIALAAGVDRCLLASGVTYAATEQEGSNYITDRLWSNGGTDILHDGADATRLQKIEQISGDPAALEILRVCWLEQGYNCGECEKCLRTMTSLRLLGLRATHLPELTDEMVKRRVAGLRIYSPQAFSFVEENLGRAMEVGDRPLIKALRRLRRDYLVRRHLRGLFNALR